MTASPGPEWLHAEVTAVFPGGLDGVGPAEDLLDLGIDSVRLMLLVERWQSAGFDVDLVGLAERPTLAGWLELLRAGAPSADPAPGTAGPLTTTVLRIEQLTPRMVRVTLDDRAARFAGARPGAYALLRADGIAEARPVTVHPHPASGEVDVDLVVHDQGPLGRWAGGVRRGAEVLLDGPHGVPELPGGPADWTLLVADHPAQPALAARVAALGAADRAVVVAVVPDAAEEQLLPTAADLTTVFVHTGDVEPVLRAVRAAVPGTGRGRAWLAGERHRVHALGEALAALPALAGRCVAEPYGAVPAVA
ncbi:MULTISPECIES: SIP domain-containing protein [Pseudonocardia]|uniref:Isochorismatase n=2 Tax=Pseudonocardia TaxID=1847 RepID=A0A1Y2MNB0_PSEAH|nr:MULTISPECIES: SIP domain-containing protein [Pseudonocardia]OSY36734.1 Isochorismatase [Pseudonocardia autotrophica]TDN77151.1 NADPH-dependent ferric siderophore reductase [Pseudonocardia autotrophica]BBG01156.1 hypothetical protein Pdca_23650 [Pseudonocardia autotrophica]GEC26788.1 hypothetical protein PSA01_38170 [Pseudonocardia saturnea]